MELTQKKCKPCEGGTAACSLDEAHKMMAEVKGWELTTDGKSISRLLTFKDFVKAMLFVNDVAALAESEGHHPDIFISWNKVKLTLWTHAIGGLSDNEPVSRYLCISSSVASAAASII